MSSKGAHNTASSATNEEGDNAANSGSLARPGGNRKRFTSLKREKSDSSEPKASSPLLEAARRAVSPSSRTSSQRGNSMAGAAAISKDSEGELLAQPAGSRRSFRSRGTYSNMEQLRARYRQDEEGGGDDTGDSEEDAKGDEPKDRRSRILRELIETERDYIRDLQIMVDLYIDPLLSRGILSTDDIRLAFSNVRELIGINQELLTKLEDGTISVGAAFKAVMPYFSLYSVYVANQDAALQFVVDRARSDTTFDTFLYYTQFKPRSRNLDLKSFLIKPVQRVCKYPLLLNELLKATPAGAAARADLVQAAEAVQGAVVSINEKKRELENTVRMLSVQTRLSNPQDLVQPSRRYVAEGILLEDDSAAPEAPAREVGMFFLFNDVLFDARPSTQMRSMMRSGSSLSSFLSSVGLAVNSDHAAADAGEDAGAGRRVALDVADTVDLAADVTRFEQLPGEPPTVALHVSKASLPPRKLLLRPADREQVAETLKLLEAVDTASKERKMLKAYQRYAQLAKTGHSPEPKREPEPAVVVVPPSLSPIAAPPVPPRIAPRVPPRGNNRESRRLTRVGRPYAFKCYYRTTLRIEFEDAGMITMEALDARFKDAFPGEDLAFSYKDAKGDIFPVSNMHTLDTVVADGITDLFLYPKI